MNMPYMLNSIGAPIVSKAYMFCDNASVIISSNITQSSLNKRHHNALSYHAFIREAIALDHVLWCGWFFHIPGKVNPADVLTKFCGHALFGPLIKPNLCWAGVVHLPPVLSSHPAFSWEISI